MSSRQSSLSFFLRHSNYKCLYVSEKKSSRVVNSLVRKLEVHYGSQRKAVQVDGVAILAMAATHRAFAGLGQRRSSVDSVTL